MQPAYQPSGNFPAAGAMDLRYANAAANNTLPPQTQTTIGDQLSARGIGWTWYATARDAAVTDGAQPAGSAHTVIYTPGFFFQAEDGIRDVAVTGVQTCALPI